MNLSPLLECLWKGCSDGCRKGIEARTETSNDLVDEGPIGDKGSVGRKKST